MWDRICERRLTPLTAFCLGGGGIGSMANIAPWYVGPIFLLIGLILITHIVVAEWIHRPLKSFWFWIPVALWLLLAGLSWEKYFEPKITANNVASARAIIAANTGQCVDLGRKQALENLADSHVDLGRIDDADLDNLNLPPNKWRDLALQEGEH